MSEMTENIVTRDNRNSTIDQGIRLLDTPGDLTITLKAKAAGLQLTLIGLAEIQALRIQNLAISAYRLEQKLYSPEAIDRLEPRKILNAYEALNAALKDAITYVKSMGAIDFKGLEQTLYMLAQEDPSRQAADGEEAQTKSSVSRLAQDLLSQLTDPSKNGDGQIVSEQ